VSTFSSGILNQVANLTTDNQDVAEQLEFSSCISSTIFCHPCVARISITVNWEFFMDENIHKLNFHVNNFFVGKVPTKIFYHEKSMQR